MADSLYGKNEGKKVVRITFRTMRTSIGYTLSGFLYL